MIRAAVAVALSVALCMAFTVIAGSGSYHRIEVRP